jgi:hypothetical protein
MALGAITAGLHELSRAKDVASDGFSLFVEAACAVAAELPVEELGPAVHALCGACQNPAMKSAETTVAVVVLAQQCARKSAIGLDAEFFARSASGATRRPGKRGRQAAATRKASEEPGAEKSLSMCVAGVIGIGKHAAKSLAASFVPSCKILEAVTASLASMITWMPVPCARAHSRQVTLLLDGVVTATDAMAHARLRASAFRARQLWGGGSTSEQLQAACALLQTSVSKSTTELANAVTILAAHLSIAPTTDAVQVRRDIGRSDSTACALGELALLFGIEGITVGGIVLAVCRLLDVASRKIRQAQLASSDGLHQLHRQVSVSGAVQLLDGLLRHESGRASLIPFAHRLDASLRDSLHRSGSPVQLQPAVAASAAGVLAALARLTASPPPPLEPTQSLSASAAAAVIAPYVLETADAVVVGTSGAAVSSNPAAAEASSMPAAASASSSASSSAGHAAEGARADDHSPPAPAMLSGPSSGDVAASNGVEVVAAPDAPSTEAAVNEADAEEDDDDEFPDIV